MRRTCALCMQRVAEVAKTRGAFRSIAIARPFASTSMNTARFRSKIVPTATTLRDVGLPENPAEASDAILMAKDIAFSDDVQLQIEEDPVVDDRPPKIDEKWLETWTSIGVPEIIARRLLTAFPHIEAPTPAQRAFILSVFKGKDVYLKDHMGRGKTLAIAIVAASLARRTLSQRTSTEPTGHEILVLLPSTHLLHQVERDMLLLDPSFHHPEHPFAPSEQGERSFAVLVGQAKQGKKAAEDIPKRRTDLAVPEDMVRAPVLLATPQDFWSQRDHIDITNVRTIIVDESDTMLPSLPGRHTSGLDDPTSALNRHPPPLLSTINYVLNIKEEIAESGTMKPEVPIKRVSRKFLNSPKRRLDFSQRKDIQTVWTSGTISSALRRFSKLRGWIRSSHLVDLDFSPDATARHVDIRNEALSLDQKAETGVSSSSSTSDIFRPQPDHYVLTVDATDGGIFSLLPDEQDEAYELPPTPKGGMQLSLVEALGLIHATSPPPPGTYALAVCPEGVSIDALQRELNTYGIQSLHLRPEVMHDVSALEPDMDGESPIFLARHSIVPGLHLPHLHTVYLMEGLDVPDGSPTSMVLERIAFYEIAAGRVGRLGTGSADGSVAKPRIISIVNQGTQNESVLQDMFFGRFSTRQSPNGASATAKEKEMEKRWKLKSWDVGAFKDTINELAFS